MNDFILNMYIVAVQSERFTIDFVPFLYRKKSCRNIRKRSKKNN